MAGTDPGTRDGCSNGLLYAGRSPAQIAPPGAPFPSAFPPPPVGVPFNTARERLTPMPGEEGATGDGTGLRGDAFPSRAFRVASGDLNRPPFLLARLKKVSESTAALLALAADAGEPEDTGEFPGLIGFDPAIVGSGTSNMKSSGSPAPRAHTHTHTSDVSHTRDATGSTQAH